MNRLLFLLLITGCTGSSVMTCSDYCPTQPHIMCVGEWNISGIYPDCNCVFVCRADGIMPRYSLSDVSVHSDINDCWLVINNSVYDVTSFIPSHPGGIFITQGCGKNATDIFETRLMGSGTPHSINARQLLSEYFIGSLN